MDNSQYAIKIYIYFCKYCIFKYYDNFYRSFLFVVYFKLGLDLKFISAKNDKLCFTIIYIYNIIRN